MKEERLKNRWPLIVSVVSLILIAALASWFVLVPVLGEVNENVAKAARQAEESRKKAAEADFNTLLKPAASDAHLAGDWLVVFRGTGLPVIYRLNADGTAQEYFPNSMVGKTNPYLVVTWGRLKGDNGLVIREVNGDRKSDKHIAYNAANDTLLYEGYLVMNRVNYQAP